MIDSLLRNVRRIILVATVLLAVLIIFLSVSKQNKVIYKNGNFGFTLTMNKKTYEKFEITENPYGVYFMNKDIYESSLEDMAGIVFRVEAYPKGRFTEKDLKERKEIYNLQYIGENDKFYFGWAYPTDVQYPPDDEELKKSYTNTMNQVSSIIKTMEIVEPESHIYVYNEKLNLAYEGKMDGIEFSVGDNGEDVVKKWGEPQEMDYFAGGLYLKYNNIVFYTDGYIYEGKVYHGKILRMTLFNNEGTYGIKSGMSIYEIEEILGVPNFRAIYDDCYRTDPDGFYGEDNIAYYLAGDYMVTIPYNKDTNNCRFIELGSSEYYRYLNRNSFLELSDIEKKAYDNFIIDFNEEEISNLFSLSIMKLYLHAQKEKNYEAEWELYTKEEHQMGWDKEEHMKIPEEDRVRDFRHFENPVNIKIEYSDDCKEATISWEDKNFEEYDASGNPFRFSFRLVLDKDRIWRVCFLPMQ